MTFTFPLVSPLPIYTVGANAGSVIVCLVPGATPRIDPNAKHISITMTLSSPSVFAMATFSPLTVITFKDGVCTVSGPPAYVIPTMLEGIKFTYDLHRDISKEKIAVVIHDGAAVSMQTLTFATHDSIVQASIAAANTTTFIINEPSPFPKIVLLDKDGSGKAQAAVTIIPEMPSAITSMGTDSKLWASVHINAMTNAGKYDTETLGSIHSVKNVTDKTILSFCYRGTVAHINEALASTHFVAPQAISGNTVLQFVIVISDDTSTIMSQRIKLNGVHAKSTEAIEYPIFGTMNKSALPPASVNGVPFTLQIVNGTPTWTATNQAAAIVLPVNAAPPSKPTVAILAPFTSTVSSNDVNSVENLRTVAAMTAPAAAPSAIASDSKTSTTDNVLTILIVIVSLGLFGFLGWIIFKDWSSA
jgi:hypothetical protein